MKYAFGAAVALSIAVSSSGAWSQGEGKGRLNIGLEAPRSISNVPMLLAVDRMTEEGYDVEVIDFQSPETMALALQSGDVDIASTSAGTAFSAIDAGFDARAFMGSARADFQMVAKPEFDSCESLDGKRVAVQSREGTTGVLTLRWFEQECPEARPNILIVAGSENRIAGLIAGQLDAAPVDTQNTAQLMQMRPDEFITIPSFSETADLLGSVYYGSRQFLEENREVVQEFVSTYVEVVEEGYANPTLFKEKLNEILPDSDPAVLDRVVDIWVEQEIYVPVRGVQPEVVQNAIEFYSTARPYQSVSEAADVATDEFVSGLQ